MMRKFRVKIDSFCFHVHNPGELLVIFIMLVAFFAGLGVWGVIDCLQPIDETNGQEYRLSFSGWEIDADTLILSSAQMQEPFVINGYEDYLSGFSRMTARCDGNTMFSVWAERIERDGDPAYLVYEISSDEEVYRTFEDSAAYRRSEIPIMIAVFSAFLVGILALAAVIFIVGSNPQKFPRWVVFCFFKKNAIEI